jgi:Zn-dependent protease with chaperone function
MAQPSPQFTAEVALAHGAVPVTAPAAPCSPLDGFNGTILPTEVSPLYKSGLALVALGMVLLPLFYAAVVAFTAWASWDCLVHGAWVVSVPGVILVAFMLKPLLAKRPPQPVTYTLLREKEPLLFDFIDRICALVRAPVPRRVDVNCEVNASAGFPRGMLSVLGNELVLTIGLPLAAGLNMREFAGVLAHEFGHFA